MRLVRYHAAGNDYQVLHDRGGVDRPLPGLAEALCHRHTGVGSDGLLVPVLAEGADSGLRIYNPDGSEAEKSGNGLRIFARYLHEYRGAPARLRIALRHETVAAEILAGSRVRVEMGRARFEPAAVPVLHEGPDTLAVPLVVAGQALEATCVGLGNPHCVVFVEAELSSLPWRTWGQALESHPAFPHRTNVQVARVVGTDRVEVRIWERGVGETASSGSSASAVAAAAVCTGRVGSRRIEVVSPGGRLGVEVGEGYRVQLEGEVVGVAEVEVLRGWLASAAAEGC